MSNTNPGGELRWFIKVCSSCSTSDTCHATVKQHKHHMIWKLWWTSIYVNKFKLQIKHEPVQKHVRRKTNWTITVDITTRNYKHEVMYTEDMNNTNPTETCHKLGRTQMLLEGDQFLLNYVVFFYIKFKLKMAINVNHSSRLRNI